MIKIYAVAPGYPFDITSLKLSFQVLNQRGYQVHLPEDTLCPKWFHSNSDKKRADFLVEAILSDTVDIIWAIRGGYGSNRTLMYLNQSLPKLKRAKKKIFLGLSDVTSLHLFFNQILRWKTWHAPVLEALGRPQFPKAQLKNLDMILRTNALDLKYPLKPLNSKAKELRQMSPAIMLGGNLTVFQSHLGTRWLGSLKNRALFFEDVGERGYRIDRALWQIRESMNFSDVKAVFFGEFTGGLEPDGKSSVKKALMRFASEVEVPVFSGIKSGHGGGYQSIPLGAPIAIANQKLVLNP